MSEKITLCSGPNTGNQHGTVAHGTITLNGNLAATYKHKLKTGLVTVTYEGQSKTTQVGGLKAEQVAEMLLHELMAKARRAA